MSLYCTEIHSNTHFENLATKLPIPFHFVNLSIYLLGDFGMKKIVATFETQESAQRYVDVACVCVCMYETLLF